jgi:hypothetical protein
MLDTAVSLKKSNCWVNRVSSRKTSGEAEVRKKENEMKGPRWIDDDGGLLGAKG